MNMNFTGINTNKWNDNKLVALSKKKKRLQDISKTNLISKPNFLDKLLDLTCLHVSQIHRISKDMKRKKTQNRRGHF